MKTAILAIGVIVLSSCSSSKDLIQRSDVAITTKDEKILYLKDSQMGRQIYDTWMSGVYGTETQVYLVSEPDFEKMSKR